MAELRKEVQLHDATLCGLEVGAGGRVVLHLEGVTIYQPVAFELYDIQVYEADLIVDGVAEMSVRGLWTEGDDDYILEDTAIGAQDQEIPWGALEDKELSAIRLFLFSGATIEMKCSKAEFLWSRNHESMGQWRGPLISGREHE